MKYVFIRIINNVIYHYSNKLESFIQFNNLNDVAKFVNKPFIQFVSIATNDNEKRNILNNVKYLYR
jgi:hypothetical protein